jgi:hypothetical protein
MARIRLSLFASAHYRFATLALARLGYPSYFAPYHPLHMPSGHEGYPIRRYRLRGHG